MAIEVRPGELEAGTNLVDLTAPQEMHEAGHAVAAGAVLGERLVVERLLGSGGMGSVVLARHRELGEPRAIKLLRPDRITSAESRRRLIREARTAAQLQGAHVVRVFDVVSEGPHAPYLVMEYLIGETLATRLARAPLTTGAAAAIVIQTCEALAEAHRAGTIHRDLKPSNLFLVARDGRDDFVKVLDFGIAQTEESRLADWTHSDALLASPPYASPEQLRASKDVDRRSDIWSLGVILYECLAGRRPFEGDALPELSSRILRDDPPPLRGFCPDLPEELDRAINRCLHKRREERFSDVAALVEALAQFAPAAAAASQSLVRELLSTPPTDAAEPGDAAEGQDATVTSPSVRARRRSTVRRPLVALIAGGLVLGALGAATALGWLGRRETSVPPATAPSTTTATPTATTTASPAPAPAKVAIPAPPPPAAQPPPAVFDRAPRHADRTTARVRRIPRPSVEEGHRQKAIPVDELPLDQLIDGRK